MTLEDWLMNAVYNGFFNLLNQAILLVIMMMSGEGHMILWLNIPFALLFLWLNGAAILISWREGVSRGLQFYAKANIRCFMILAGGGLFMTCLATAGSRWL